MVLAFTTFFVWEGLPSQRPQGSSMLRSVSNCAPLHEVKLQLDSWLIPHWWSRKANVSQFLSFHFVFSRAWWPEQVLLIFLSLHFVVPFSKLDNFSTSKTVNYIQVNAVCLICRTRLQIFWFLGLSILLHWLWCTLQGVGVLLLKKWSMESSITWEFGINAKSQAPFQPWWIRICIAWFACSLKTEKCWVKKHWNAPMYTNSFSWWPGISACICLCKLHASAMISSQIALVFPVRRALPAGTGKKKICLKDIFSLSPEKRKVCSSSTAA